MAEIQKNVAEDIYGLFVRPFEERVLKVQEHEQVDHVWQSFQKFYNTARIFVQIVHL
jgi:hypothetical protein